MKRFPAVALGLALVFAWMGTALGGAKRGNGQVMSKPAALDYRVWWGREVGDPDWVSGRVLTPVALDAAWSRLEQVETWAAIFSDLRRFEVRLSQPPHWRVHVETESFFPCGAHDCDIVFRKDEGAIDIGIEAPGVESRASLTVRPDGDQRTLLTFRVFVRPTGLMGWFASKKDLQRRQEEMVVRYLTDLRRTFGGGGSTSRQRDESKPSVTPVAHSVGPGPGASR